MQNDLKNDLNLRDNITVKILDRDFKIKCPKDKIAELQNAASYLDDKMREIHHNNKLSTIDRIAITAALNIANELILIKQKSQTSTDELEKRLFDLKNKLHQALESAA
jgi:cell division protein ZapA